MTQVGRQVTESLTTQFDKQVNELKMELDTFES